MCKNYFSKVRKEDGVSYFRLTAKTYFILFQIQSAFGIPWTPLYYVNYNDSYTDFFFDRITSIYFNVTDYQGCAERNRLIATGVLITPNQILTSYNPFREYSRSAVKKKEIIVSILVGRRRILNGSWIFYTPLCKISCGRQVVFLPDIKIAKDQWHGTDRRHSPLHDLMIMRVDCGGGMKISKLRPNEYTLAKFPLGVEKEFQPGAFITKIAGPRDILGGTFKFVSLGHQRPHEHQACRNLHLTKYEADEHAEVDCDRWLPRSWGYFICLINTKNHISIGSGAMLFSNNTLFGIGSFALFKGKKSVLVFTDVRPYYALVFKACTIDDSTIK